MKSFQNQPRFEYEVKFNFGLRSTSVSMSRDSEFGLGGTTKVNWHVEYVGTDHPEGNGENNKRQHNSRSLQVMILGLVCFLSSIRHQGKMTNITSIRTRRSWTPQTLHMLKRQIHCYPSKLTISCTIRLKALQIVKSCGLHTVCASPGMFGERLSFRCHDNILLSSPIIRIMPFTSTCCFSIGILKTSKRESTSKWNDWARELYTACLGSWSSSRWSRDKHFYPFSAWQRFHDPYVDLKSDLWLNWWKQPLFWGFLLNTHTHTHTCTPEHHLLTQLSGSKQKFWNNTFFGIAWEVGRESGLELCRACLPELCEKKERKINSVRCPPAMVNTFVLSLAANSIFECVSVCTSISQFHQRNCNLKINFCVFDFQKSLLSLWNRPITSSSILGVIWRLIIRISVSCTTIAAQRYESFMEVQSKVARTVDTTVLIFKTTFQTSVWRNLSLVVLNWAVSPAGLDKYSICFVQPNFMPWTFRFRKLMMLCFFGFTLHGMLAPGFSGSRSQEPGLTDPGEGAMSFFDKVAVKQESFPAAGPPLMRWRQGLSWWARVLLFALARQRVCCSASSFHVLGRDSMSHANCSVRIWWRRKHQEHCKIVSSA